MKLIQSEIATKIRGYNPASKKLQNDPQQLIADAKKFQKWTNNRIDALAAGGVPKNVSIGRMSKKPVKEIKTVSQAKRAIARAKQLANNPLASVRNYNKLIKDAEKKFGTRGAHGGWKVIPDPTNPNTPIAVPRGTEDSKKHRETYITARRILSDFWEWYTKIGQLYLDSKQDVPNILERAERTGRDPIEVAEEYIRETYGEDVYNDYLTHLTDLYATMTTSPQL